MNQLQVVNSAEFGILAGSGNILAGGDNLGVLNKVTIGSNLTLTGGVLSAIGGGSGSVTSVAALTLGTTGTDVSSTVATGTTTPVITLNIPTASATNRGALSSADWTTFNNKQAALNGTGFVKATGTTISYDNSTYLTTTSAASTYLPLAGGTLTGALSIILTTTNTSALAVTQYSITGANAQSLLDLAGAWNTTGNPTAIKLNITNTASGASSNLMDLQVGAVSKFKVDKAGLVTGASFYESSDKRQKTLIEDNFQAKGIENITPKLYTKNDKVELGYYAQDIQGILDGAVSEDEKGMLSLSYREVHTAKIYALELEIKELKELIKSIIDGNRN